MACTNQMYACRSIPPLLLLWYNFIGRGATLRIACRICFYLSFTCGVLALVLLWLVYPREVSFTPDAWCHMCIVWLLLLASICLSFSVLAHLTAASAGRTRQSRHWDAVFCIILSHVREPHAVMQRVLTIYSSAAILA